MALNPESKYPLNVAPSDANYPYGSARNVVTVGDGTGTPWDEDIVNDVFGFQQAVLSEAGITPSGVADTSVASQYLEGLNQLHILKSDTLSLALARTDIKEGMVIDVTERTAGNGGGAKWDVVLTSSVTPNTFNIVQCTGIPTLSLVLRIGDFVNVRHFGAKGDDNNDNASFIAAIAYCIDNKRKLYIPSGVYVVTNIDVNITRVSLDDFDNFNIIGEDENNTIIKGGITATYLFNITTGITPLPISIKFENLSLLGDDTVPAALIIENIARFQVSRVRIYKFTGISIDIRGSLICYFTLLDISKCATGIKLNKLNSIYPNAITIKESSITECTNRAVDVVRGLMVRIRDVDFEVNGTLSDTSTGAIFVSADTGEEISAEGVGIVITGCWFEGNTGNVVNINSGKPKIKDCQFINSSSDNDIFIAGNALDYNISDCSLPNINGAIDTSGSSGGFISDTFAGTMSLNTDVTTLNSNNGYRRGFTSDLEICNDNRLLLTTTNGTVVGIIESDSVDDNLLLTASSGKEVRTGSTLRINNHSWDANLLRLENNYLWVDGTGDLRIKSGAPTSDTDGVVVGTQS